MKTHIIKKCTYKGEEYLVRNDGYVMRKSRPNCRHRKLDNVWTTGKKNLINGYLYIGQHRVHIIVATAFLGPMDSKVYVVDHIDTNRCNNRVENLKWVTRLDNVLLNHITANKVTYLCNGDITKFIDDPSVLRNLSKPNTDVEWMRPVSETEGKNTLNNLSRLAGDNHQKEENDFYQKSKMILEQMFFETNDIVEIVHPEKRKNKEWVYNDTPPVHPDEIHQEVIRATSPENALQLHWKTPSTFPCCPISTDSSLQDYQVRLVKGTTFVTNNLYSNRVLDSVLIDNGKTLLVASKGDGVKKFALCKIHQCSGEFIHESIGTFFTENGMLKQFTILQGLEWTGEDSIDDYCS